jgi:hypothetical protein
VTQNYVILPDTPVTYNVKASLCFLSQSYSVFFFRVFWNEF